MNWTKTIVVMVTTTLVISSFAVAEGEKKYKQELVDPSEGDFFEFDLDPSALEQVYIDDPDLDVKAVESNVLPTFLMTYHGESCLNFPLLSPNECHKLVTTLTMNLTLIHDDDSDVYEDDTVITMSIVTITESVDGAMWSEQTIESETWMRISGQDWHVERVEVETEEVTYQGSHPLEVSVGDSWTVSEESERIITSRERLDGGEWETETTEEYESTTTNYNAESSGNVFVNGESFDSIKISAMEIGSSAMEVWYSNEYGLPVKAEIYDDDGNLEMIITLKEYKYANEPTDGALGGLPGFNATAAIAMIGIATVFPRWNRDE